MAVKQTVRQKQKSIPKKTRQGDSANTKRGNKGSKKYKKPTRGQG